MQDLSYKAEAEARWGNTKEYKQSAARTKKYAEADWQNIKAEALALAESYAALMKSGVSPENPEAQALAGQHCQHFNTWYYDCSPQMLGEVSKLWVSDERFTANIDTRHSGLATYQYAAVQAWVKSL